MAAQTYQSRHGQEGARAALNSLLDEADTSLTLTTSARAVVALGKRMRFELSEA